jgi:hypothetical protein
LACTSHTRPSAWTAAAVFRCSTHRHDASDLPSSIDPRASGAGLPRSRPIPTRTSQRRPGFGAGATTSIQSRGSPSTLAMGSSSTRALEPYPCSDFGLCSDAPRSPTGRGSQLHDGLREVMHVLAGVAPLFQQGCLLSLSLISPLCRCRSSELLESVSATHPFPPQAGCFSAATPLTCGAHSKNQQNPCQNKCGIKNNRM